MTDTEHIGRVITRLREERKLSKKRLARESFISDAYLVQIEQGKRAPSEKVLRRLAAAMQVPPWHLLEPAGVYAPEVVAEAEKWRDEARTRSGPRALTPSDLDTSYGAWLENFSGSALADPDYFSRLQHPAETEIDQSFRSRPEGWDELSDKDQRLAQQLINRLRYVESESD